MLIVDYKSKSYYRFLDDILLIAKHKKRFLITLNGGTADELLSATEDLSLHTQSTVKNSIAIIEKASQDVVSSLFDEARSNRYVLIFKNSDLLFDRKATLKNSHERESIFDINNLFKNIATHNGIVALATESKQTLSASMSTKVDVLVRF